MKECVATRKIIEAIINKTNFLIDNLKSRKSINTAEENNSTAAKTLIK